MTVLVTGFGPFDGGSNASEKLVRTLAGRRAGSGRFAGLEIETLILPVDTDRAGELLLEAVERVRPTHLLLTGQAAGRSRLSFERYATNRRDFAIPDISGLFLSGLPVLEAAPARHVSTWPDIEGIIAALAEAGIPAQISEDCGTYLCNQVLFVALHRALPQMAVAFLHVPLLPEQVSAREPAAERHANCPSIPLDTMVRAVEITLSHSVTLGAAA